MFKQFHILGGILIFGTIHPLRGFFIGIGSSLISKPFRKEMSGEHLDFDDSVSEALIFGVLGAGIGSGVDLLNTAATSTESTAAVVALTGAALAGVNNIKSNRT